MSGAGRFAPSPTGELHLGNLRTALVAWLFARSSGRSMLLRIEDLDRDRSRPEHERQQRVDLAALGMTFDPPELRQSERAGAYAAALRSLAGQTYECFCSRRDIAEATSAPHVASGRYPGTCRDLTPAERTARRRERPAAIRLRAVGAEQSVHDLLAGDVTAPVDDLVLQRNDGAYAYHLTVVVDDVASGIDQVVRGADLLDTAPSQAHLTRLLGSTPPTYIHVPLVLGPSGVRLAKRDGAVTLSALATEGVGAEDVLGALAVSLGVASSGEAVDLATLLARFEPELLPRTPWTYTGHTAIKATAVGRT